MAPRLSLVSVWTFVLGLAIETVGDLNKCQTSHICLPLTQQYRRLYFFPLLPVNPFGIVQQMIIKEASKNNCMLNRCSAAPVLSVSWQRLCLSGQNCRCANKRRTRRLRARLPLARSLACTLADLLGSARPIPKTLRKDWMSIKKTKETRCRCAY